MFCLFSFRSPLLASSATVPLRLSVDMSQACHSARETILDLTGLTSACSLLYHRHHLNRHLEKLISYTGAQPKEPLGKPSPPSSQDDCQCSEHHLSRWRPRALSLLLHLPIAHQITDAVLHFSRTSAGRLQRMNQRLATSL